MENVQTQRGIQRETRRELTGPESENAIRLYYCGSESCTPGHFFGPAVRPHYLIHFIRSGKGTYLRRDEVHELSRGDAFLILPGETTKYIADEKEPWDYTWVAFDGTNAEALLRCCGFLSGNLVYRSPDEETRKRLLRQADAFENCFQDEKRNVLELLGNFYLLFSCMYPEGAGQGGFSFTDRLNRDWTMQMAGQSGPFLADGAPSPSGQELYFRQAVSYLQHNFSYPVRIEQLARQIGVSRSYLYKTFLSCSGKSVQQYLRDLRLKEACRLLADTQRAVTDIAYSCGFPDSPSFCRTFHNVYGRTPLQFRRRMAKGKTCI
ncbi:MAG TPA: AraC family transcriptional regulator [Candidatus Eisenbergiella merdipullorum]|uniref:AraC family transcriptional regulator n=1 Tax=Candidatus Eisenbergiella merdipullorum TaxID=2838553 RepID=A0A9D2I7F1_9FIRM|nr:AraC family transcriptional regulator [Candidatus Eisenbergiella merdipullorum]